jgi:type IV pilus assembly protein PilE
MALIPIETGDCTNRGRYRRPDFARMSGHTLIEMLLVLVILAILIGIVVPTYRDFVLKANRAVGRGVLLDVMARQEQYYINNKSYASSLEDLGFPATYYVDRLAADAGAAEAVYQIELLLQSSAYQGVRAIPQNSQQHDTRCMILAISKRGLKTVSGADAENPFSCW